MRLMYLPRTGAAENQKTITSENVVNNGYWISPNDRISSEKNINTTLLRKNTTTSHHTNSTIVQVWSYIISATRISNTSKSTVLLCRCSNAIKTVERIRNDKDHSCSCPTMPSCPLLSPLVLSVRQDTCHLPTSVGGIIIIISSLKAVLPRVVLI